MFFYIIYLYATFSAFPLFLYIWPAPPSSLFVWISPTHTGPLHAAPNPLKIRKRYGKSHHFYTSKSKGNPLGPLQNLQGRTAETPPPHNSRPPLSPFFLHITQISKIGHTTPHTSATHPLLPNSPLFEALYPTLGNRPTTPLFFHQITQISKM